MQFIGTGNRILTENFNVGYLYTITFKTGIYINSACIGIGDTFVMFQKAEPDLLFTLNVDTADEVNTIELYDSGGGTNDYDDLANRPQINSHTLTGNMSGADLGLQNTISDLDTIRAGAAAGTTSVQPADMTSALAAKQDVLTTEQLAAVNSGITSTDVAQITTNKNNISYIANNNVINILNRQAGTYTSNGVTFTTNIDGSITLSGTATNAASVLVFSSSLDTTDDTYILYGDGFIEGVYMDTYETGWANQRTFTSWVETVPNTKIWRLIVSNGTNADNVTVRPMMCKKSLFDGSYYPPAMSNAELTAAIKVLQAQLANQ